MTDADTCSKVLQGGSSWAKNSVAASPAMA
jgi:hypothetical protein